MVYSNTLTATQKDKKIPLIIKRDGNVCFYCKQVFVQQIPELRREIDHLNNNAFDNRFENLCICHAECNQKKKTNHDWQIVAVDHLHENITNASLSESEGEKHAETHKDIDELKEGDINLIVNKLVPAELESQFSNKNDYTGISYNRLLKKIHYLLITQTGGRGSEQAVRRSLDAYCSDYAPWKSEKLGKGNRIIRRRKPDELG